MTKDTLLVQSSQGYISFLYAVRMFRIQSVFQGNKCHIPQQPMTEFHMACRDILKDAYPDQPRLVDFYIRKFINSIQKQYTKLKSKTF